MKKIFLPKAINAMTSRQYCVSTEKGASSTDMHWHDCIEIIYIDKGDAFVFFNNKWNTVKEKTMIFIPPGRVHCCKCTNPESERIVIGATKKLINICHDAENESDMQFSTDTIDQYCINSVEEKTDESLHRMAELENERPCAYPILIQAEILKLYAYMYSLWSGKNVLPERTEENKLATQIKKRIAEDFVNPPDASEMAAQMHISYSYMYKLLRKTLNIGYDALLHSVRIDAAKKLLLTTDKSITEIAQDCGFCDSSYFAKLFKRYVGVTPKKYRDRRCGEERCESLSR